MKKNSTLVGFNYSKITYLIQYEWRLDIGSGGPPGYLANLRYGLDRLSRIDDGLCVWINAMKAPAVNHSKVETDRRSWRHKLRQKLRSPFSRARLARQRAQEFSHHMDHIEKMSSECPDQKIADFIKKYGIKIVHTHYALDAVRMNNLLRQNDMNNVKLAFTSHSPEAPSIEMANLFREEGCPPCITFAYENVWRKIEERAFSESDILVFPSKEAVEPYVQTMPTFQQVTEGKDFRYVQTGVRALQSPLSKDEAKKKFGVEGKTVFSYIGRHIPVKGYDLLIDAAIKLLGEKQDIVFLVGGHASKTLTPPSHPNWKELGWVNSAEVLAASDAFVLPNRRTFFDLVLLEALSMGIPVIASATGGTKTVQKETGALLLFDIAYGAEGLIQTLKQFLSLDTAQRVELAERCRAAYMEKYTAEKFAANFALMAGEIYADHAH